MSAFGICFLRIGNKAEDAISTLNIYENGVKQNFIGLVWIVGDFLMGNKKNGGPIGVDKNEKSLIIRLIADFDYFTDDRESSKSLVCECDLFFCKVILTRNDGEFVVPIILYFLVKEH